MSILFYLFLSFAYLDFNVLNAVSTIDVWSRGFIGFIWSVFIIIDAVLITYLLRGKKK